MSNGHTRQADGFHAPERVRQGVELHLHLAGLRRVEPAPLEAAPDVHLHHEGELQRQSQPLVVEALQAFGQELAVFGEQGCVARGGRDCRAGHDGRAPVGAEVVLHGVQDGDEHSDGALRVGAVG